jgi:hypothetical protein
MQRLQTCVPFGALELWGLPPWLAFEHGVSEVTLTATFYGSKTRGTFYRRGRCSHDVSFPDDVSFPIGFPKLDSCAFMLARICLVASVATASATLELTPENWQAEVTDSGKSAFIK